MIRTCYICHKMFKEDDEIRAEMDAYWHELASKVNFSISRPHNVVAASLRHLSCENSEA